MAQLTSESVVAIHHLAIHHDAAAHTCTQGDHDKVLHTASHAVGHLADGGSVSVVGDQARDAEFLSHHVSQGNRGRPGQVRSLVDKARVVVAVGGADADALDLALGVIRLDDAGQLGVQLVNVVIEVAVFCCLDGIACDYSAASVHDTKDGVSAAHVDTDYIRFCHDLNRFIS